MVKLPAFPQPADLVEFNIGAATSFRFYIDAKSLSVSDDGVVRYTLVARSTSGAESVSYEGMRCSSGTYKVYAYGRRDGGWTERQSDWRPIEPKSVSWHQSLRREFFCPHQHPIDSPEEGIRALRLGRHPRL